MAADSNSEARRAWGGVWPGGGRRRRRLCGIFPRRVKSRTVRAAVRTATCSAVAALSPSRFKSPRKKASAELCRSWRAFKVASAVSCAHHCSSVKPPLPCCSSATRRRARRAAAACRYETSPSSPPLPSADGDVGGAAKRLTSCPRALPRRTAMAARRCDCARRYRPSQSLSPPVSTPSELSSVKVGGVYGRRRGLGADCGVAGLGAGRRAGRARVANENSFVRVERLARLRRAKRSIWRLLAANLRCSSRFTFGSRAATPLASRETPASCLEVRRCALLPDGAARAFTSAWCARPAPGSTQFPPLPSSGAWPTV